MKDDLGDKYLVRPLNLTEQQASKFCTLMLVECYPHTFDVKMVLGEKVVARCKVDFFHFVFECGTEVLHGLN